MQDGGEVLFLDGVGEVVVSIGRSGFSLQHLHPVRSGPVISCPFACSRLLKASSRSHGLKPPCDA